MTTCIDRWLYIIRRRSALIHCLFLCFRGLFLFKIFISRNLVKILEDRLVCNNICAGNMKNIYFIMLITVSEKKYTLLVCWWYAPQCCCTAEKLECHSYIYFVTHTSKDDFTKLITFSKWRNLSDTLSKFLYNIYTHLEEDLQFFGAQFSETECKSIIYTKNRIVLWINGVKFATESGPSRTSQIMKKRTTALNKTAGCVSSPYNPKPNIDHVFICRHTSNWN